MGWGWTLIWVWLGGGGVGADSRLDAFSNKYGILSRVTGNFTSCKYKNRTIIQWHHFRMFCFVANKKRLGNLLAVKQSVLKWRHNHFLSPVFSYTVLYPTESEFHFFGTSWITAMKNRYPQKNCFPYGDIVKILLSKKKVIHTSTVIFDGSVLPLLLNPSYCDF